MSSFELLRNTLKVHEQLLSSRKGVGLGKPRLASILGLSEKQVDACIQFLRDLGYPAVYGDNRWHYSDDPEAGFERVARDLIPRCKEFPLQNVALLLMLQKGMQSIRGTNFWGTVNRALKGQRDEHFLIADSTLREMFSFRQRAVEWRDPTSFEKVVHAVYERRQITFFYTKLGHSQGENRTVNPYRMVCMDDIWYLLAFDLMRKDMRTFALTRIENAAETGLGFDRPPEGMVETMLHDAFGMIGKKKEGRVHHVRLQFNARSATRVRERKWHDSQTEAPMPDGGIELTFKLAHFSEVLEWILSWGDQVRVCEPDELIALLTRRLQSTLALYGSPDAGGKAAPATG
jgi:hypothetical protein